MYEQAVEDYHSPTLWVEYLRCVTRRSILNNTVRVSENSLLRACTLPPAGKLTDWYIMERGAGTGRGVSNRFTEASSTDADRMREVYEQALEAVGMDVAGGAAVWAGARAYEAKQLLAAPADARVALTEVRGRHPALGDRQSSERMHAAALTHSGCSGCRCAR